MPETITQNLDEENLSSEDKAKRIAAASMAARRAKTANTASLETNSEEGNSELSESRRNAVISKVNEDMTKQAETIDPAPAADGGALDNVETVNVEEEVSVSNVTDHTPEQHSEDTGNGTSDTMLDLPDKANTEGNETINFLPGKSSNVVKASVSQIIQLTDLYKAANVLPEGEARYNLIASLENLDKSFIEDRISLLKEIVASNAAKTENTPASRVAAVRPVPKVESVGTSAPLLGRNTTSSASNTEALLFIK